VFAAISTSLESIIESIVLNIIQLNDMNDDDSKNTAKTGRIIFTPQEKL
jgi:hypothetical protein